MYLAMNRFRVKIGFEEAFEEIWRSRESKLVEFDGFISFDLLKGKEEEGYVLYASHAFWRDQDCFIAWTRSRQFRQSHGKRDDEPAAKTRPQVEYAGPPEFEGFETLDGLSIFNEVDAGSAEIEPQRLRRVGE